LPTSNFAAIESRLVELTEQPVHDELQLKRMKKRKLLLKDQIAFLDSQLHPDQLA
jgi:hypothetical protein